MDRFLDRVIDRVVAVCLQVWAAAATQIFYSLGVCMGALISMASFNNFKNNTLR